MEVDTTTSARDVAGVKSGAKSQTLQTRASKVNVSAVKAQHSNAAPPGGSADATHKRDNEDSPKLPYRSSGDDSSQENTPRVIPCLPEEPADVDPVKYTSLENCDKNMVTVEEATSMRSDETASEEGGNGVEAIQAVGTTKVTVVRQEITADDSTREISGSSTRIMEYDSIQAVTVTPTWIAGVGESARDGLEMQPTETSSPQALSFGTTSSTGNQSNESSESSSFTGRYNNLVRYTHNVVSSCSMPPT